MDERIEPENRKPREREAYLRVPASVRPADRHRLEPADDDRDEDIEFLAALAAQAAHETPPAQTEPKRPARRFTVKADEELDVFKDTHVERPRPRVLNNMRIDPVEMDDLLEQLSTTAAALRRRRAA